MPFPRAVNAVIFDMDGLLFDTERLYADAMMCAAADMGAALTPEAVERTIGLPAAECQSLWADHFGPDFDVASFWSASSAGFRMLSETKLALKPGAGELLDRLDALNLPRAIATSTDRATVDRHMASAGLTDRFDTIVACGDYAFGKPHPAPYLAAAKRLAVEPAHCLALEDSHNGVRSAAAAGMMTIMVPDLLPATNEMRALTLHIVWDLHEVRALLG